MQNISIRHRRYFWEILFGDLLSAFFLIGIGRHAHQEDSQGDSHMAHHCYQYFVTHRLGLFCNFLFLAMYKSHCQLSPNNRVLQLRGDIHPPSGADITSQYLPRANSPACHHTAHSVGIPRRRRLVLLGPLARLHL